MVEHSLVQTGKWAWNELGNYLEYREPSASISTLPLLKRKDKIEAHHRSVITPRPIVDTERSHFVTLKDVKSVAISRMVEAQELSAKFLKLLRSYTMDVYLARLILYFECFIEKQELKSVVNKYHIEKSPKEKEEYRLACQKVQLARKLLGMAYANLLHAMKSGKVGSSDSTSDRIVFEILLQLSYLFVWIGMGRRDQDTIKSEINRLVRTEAFITDTNPTNRNQYNIPSKGEPKQLQLIMKQRSKIITALLPTAKEKSKHLFVSGRHKNERFKPTLLYCTDDKEGMEWFVHDAENFDPYQIKVGIIGEPLYKFNPISLSPLDPEVQTKKEHSSKREKSNMEKYLETKLLVLEREEKIKKLKVNFEEL